MLALLMLVLSERAPAVQASSGVGVVLSRPYVVGSVMLWGAYFMGLIFFYALINWMPLLFRNAGLQPQSAALISAPFPLGGVGAEANQAGRWNCPAGSRQK